MHYIVDNKEFEWNGDLGMGNAKNVTNNLPLALSVLCLGVVCPVCSEGTRN